MDNSVWNEEPKCRAAAWLDLLLLANHKDGHIRSRNGQRVAVKRGQVGWSQVKLAKRWHWSRGKVRRFMDELETGHMIVQQKSHASVLITIINYEKYQDPQYSKQNSKQYSKRYTNNNVNNDNNNTHTTRAREESYPQAPKSPITADFYPSQQTIEYCAARQLPDPTGQEALDEFINTNLSSNWSSANWDAEYRKFLPKWRLRREQKDKRTRGEKYLDALRDA